MKKQINDTWDLVGEITDLFSFRCKQNENVIGLTYCYDIAEQSTCFSAIPVESGCNAYVRTHCCYFEMDNYVARVMNPQRDHTDPRVLCSRPQSITF